MRPPSSPDGPPPPGGAGARAGARRSGRPSPFAASGSSSTRASFGQTSTIVAVPSTLRSSPCLRSFGATTSTVIPTSSRSALPARANVPLRFENSSAAFFTRRREPGAARPGSASTGAGAGAGLDDLGDDRRRRRSAPASGAGATSGASAIAPGGRRSRAVPEREVAADAEAGEGESLRGRWEGRAGETTTPRPERELRGRRGRTRGNRGAHEGALGAGLELGDERERLRPGLQLRVALAEHRQLRDQLPLGGEGLGAELLHERAELLGADRRARADELLVERAGELLGAGVALADGRPRAP